MSQEEIIWESKPSQFINFKYFFISGILAILIFRFISPVWLLIPFIFAVYKYFEVSLISYTLTSERIIIKSGVLLRKSSEIELYRILDYSVSQSIWQKIFEVWNVALTSSDRSHETIILKSIGKGEEVKDKIRYQVEHGQTNRVKREVEVQ